MTRTMQPNNQSERIKQCSLSIAHDWNVKRSFLIPLPFLGAYKIQINLSRHITITLVNKIAI